MRSGSHAVGLAVAMGEAAQVATAWLASDGCAEVGELRDLLEDSVESELNAQALCRGLDRLPNTALVGFAGWSGKELVERFDEVGVLVSAGAACHAGDSDASTTAQLFNADSGVGVIRMSLGPQTTREEVLEAVSLAAKVPISGVAR